MLGTDCRDAVNSPSDVYLASAQKNPYNLGKRLMIRIIFSKYYSWTLQQAYQGFFFAVRSQVMMVTAAENSFTSYLFSLISLCQLKYIPLDGRWSKYLYGTKNKLLGKRQVVSKYIMQSGCMYLCVLGHKVQSHFHE